MSALDDIRAAIVARLTALVDIGQVHAYERFAKDNKGFADLYGWTPAGGGQREVRGWNVRRIASRGQAQPGGALVITAWRITGFLSMVDLEASAHSADSLADAVAATFRADPGLGGLAIGDPVEGIDGPVLALSRPVMFAGVLCHELQLDWVTEHLEPSAGTGLDGEAGPVATLLDAVVTRLRATVMPPFGAVEGRLQFDPLRDAIAVPLALVVTPIRDGAAPAGTTMRVRQRVEVEFAVWLTAADRFADDAAALNAVATLRALPRQSLLGWGEAAGVTDSPITFRAGETRPARPGRLAWRDTYTTALYYQQS